MPRGVSRSAASTDTDGVTRHSASRQCTCSRSSISTCITYAIFTTSTAKATLPPASTPPLRNLNGPSSNASYAQSGPPSVRTHTYQIAQNSVSPPPFWQSLFHRNTSTSMYIVQNGLVNLAYKLTLELSLLFLLCKVLELLSKLLNSKYIVSIKLK